MRESDATKLSAMVKILLTHTPFMRRSYYGERALAGLRALGPVTLHESEAALDADTLAAAARGHQVVVSDRNTPGFGKVFDSCPDLVAFVRCAVDIRNVELARASANGVLVTRASAGFVPAVAELVLGFLVDLARGVSGAVADYRAGRVPVAAMGRQLSGSALGVIGYGAIGRRVAQLGVALGMRVLVTDPHSMASDAGIEQVSLHELLAQADYVVCLAVATGETENLMNEQAFSHMKPGAFFINVSRGNLVDEAALARALDSGWIAAAALDVGRAPDQMPTPSLAIRPDVIATPHVGGLTPEAIEHQSLETVAQVAEILRGRAPKGAVNAAEAARLERLA